MLGAWDSNSEEGGQGNFNGRNRIVSPAYRTASLRAGHPDFLDLPWDRNLSEWEGSTDRLERIPTGESRHVVVFVNYDGRVFALKQLPPGLAEKEHGLLRGMKKLNLPVVESVGHIATETPDGEQSVLVTRYLDRSLPYNLLFLRGRLERYRDHLLDAMANLLVQLHLAGVYWGDCSLFNTLFRRDAGTLQAYLVDAETSEIHPSLGEGKRQYDVDVMEENVCGGLADLDAMGALPPGFDVLGAGQWVRHRYEQLWYEITREEVLGADEAYRIQDRVRGLNQLGFSVGELDLRTVDDGRRLHLRAQVTDRNFHRGLLQTLTGLDAEEMQARLLVNEIRELKFGLSRDRNQSVALSIAAFRWLDTHFRPTLDRLNGINVPEQDPIELYCQLLEHKWYLSERALRDVGHQVACEDFVNNFEG